MYEKIFTKEYIEVMNIWAKFAFFTSVSIEKSQPQVN